MKHSVLGLTIDPSDIRNTLAKGLGGLRKGQLLPRREERPHVWIFERRQLRLLRHVQTQRRHRQAWLPDGESQILRLYVVGPSGLKDYGSATLRCKI